MSDPGITLLTSDLEDAVSTARDAAGDKNLEIFGANLAAQCLDHGLIDEIVVHVAPVLLGGGVRLYGEAGSRAQVKLELVDRAESGELTSLRYASSASGSGGRCRSRRPTRCRARPR